MPCKDSSSSSRPPSMPAGELQGESWPEADASALWHLSLCYLDWGPRSSQGNILFPASCSQAGLPPTGIDLWPTWVSLSRLEKTCVDLLQATLSLSTCSEQVQVLCAAILREMSPFSALTLSCDHMQNPHQLSLVASVLLAQVTRLSTVQSGCPALVILEPWRIPGFLWTCSIRGTAVLR